MSDFSIVFAVRLESQLPGPRVHQPSFHRNYFGENFIGNAVTAYCKKVQLQDAELLGRICQYAILAFVVLIALDQVNIGGDIVRQTFLIVLAGVVFALALAFGLGGREWAADMLERWWPRRRKP